MKRRDLHVVPDRVPRQMTLSYGKLDATERGEVAEPRSGDVRDQEFDARLAALRDGLRARGGVG